MCQGPQLPEPALLCCCVMTMLPPERGYCCCWCIITGLTERGCCCCCCCLDALKKGSKREKRTGKCMQRDVVKSATSQPANHNNHAASRSPRSTTTQPLNNQPGTTTRAAFTHPRQPHLDTKDRCMLLPCCWSPADSTSGGATQLVVLPLEWRLSLPDLSSPLAAAAAAACRRLRLRLHRSAPRAASRSTPARMRVGVFDRT